MENTLEVINRIKVDCLYGKKKHFNAADRKENYHYWIGVPLIIINVITASILFFVLTDGVTNWVRFVPLVFAITAALLSAFQTYLNLPQKVEGHRRIGNRYLSVMKRCIRVQGYFKDKLISEEELRTELEKIALDADAINIDAEAFPTNSTDYSSSQKGIETGEETYTDSELNI